MGRAWLPWPLRPALLTWLDWLVHGQAALLPSEGGAAMGLDTEFQEVSRKGRRNVADGDGYSQDGSEELRTLSPHATQVAPAVAQRLEQLAKMEGCPLANMLDDRAWSALAALSECSALQPPACLPSQRGGGGFVRGGRLRCQHASRATQVSEVQAAD